MLYPPGELAADFIRIFEHVKRACSEQWRFQEIALEKAIVRRPVPRSGSFVLEVSFSGIPPSFNPFGRQVYRVQQRIREDIEWAERYQVRHEVEIDARALWEDFVYQSTREERQAAARFLSSPAARQALDGHFAHLWRDIAMETLQLQQQPARLLRTGDGAEHVFPVTLGVDPAAGPDYTTVHIHRPGQRVREFEQMTVTNTIEPLPASPGAQYGIDLIQQIERQIMDLTAFGNSIMYVERPAASVEPEPRSARPSILRRMLDYLDRGVPARRGGVMRSLFEPPPPPPIRDRFPRPEDFLRSNFDYDWDAYARRTQPSPMRRAAEARGMELLKRHLSPEQLAQFEKRQSFDVIGSHSGKTYRIVKGTMQNVYRREGPWHWTGLCFTLDSWQGASAGTPGDYVEFVAGDVMLAQKLTLELNEPEALAIANPFAVEGYRLAELQ